MHYECLARRLIGLSEALNSVQTRRNRMKGKGNKGEKNRNTWSCKRKRLRWHFSYLSNVQSRLSPTLAISQQKSKQSWCERHVKRGYYWSRQREREREDTTVHEWLDCKNGEFCDIWFWRNISFKLRTIMSFALMLYKIK